MLDGTALPGISGGHLSDQYYLAANGSHAAISQETSLQWSSLSVGDTLTIGAWTTYRSDSTTLPSANIAYFWFNNSDITTLHNGLSNGGMGFNVMTDGLTGGGGGVAPGVWTQRSWTYTVTEADLANATDSTPWGAVEAQIGIANSSGNKQIAFDDVTLSYIPVPEPSGLALVGAALGFGLLWRRRLD